MNNAQKMARRSPKAHCAWKSTYRQDKYWNIPPKNLLMAGSEWDTFTTLSWNSFSVRNTVLFIHSGQYWVRLFCFYSKKIKLKIFIPTYFKETHTFCANRYLKWKSLNNISKFSSNSACYLYTYWIVKHHRLRSLLHFERLHTWLFWSWHDIPIIQLTLEIWNPH